MDVWEVEVGVEFGGGPDFSSFDPAVIRGIESDEMHWMHPLIHHPGKFAQNYLQLIDKIFLMSQDEIIVVSLILAQREDRFWRPEGSQYSLGVIQEWQDQECRSRALQNISMMAVALFVKTRI
ncbi:MAG: hypothetical protein JW836_08250 [Deltaproteobacteria bacterium]|nr:hypothetical protein [Deltaproteobacteria bacterium]